MTTAALNVLGLNCGTSVDAVDVALVRIASLPGSPDISVSLKSYTEYPVSSPLRARILALCRPGAATTLEEVCDLNVALGELFADAVLKSGVDLGGVDLIASHGQTLWHNPVAVPGADYAAGARRMATLQMAESSVIQQRTGITVASDFRVAELAAGRQGAPLSGFFEAALIRHPTRLRVCQNIGGMGNATVVPPATRLEAGYMAFDTGPGNVLIDAAVRIVSDGKEEYDAGGARAAAGANEVDTEFIDTWLAAQEYLSRPAPKTTGRELYSEAVGADLVAELRARGLSDNGVIATVTRLSGESIVRALRDLEPTWGTLDELAVCGGGAHNPVTMAVLAAAFPNARVGKLDDLEGTAGIPAEAKEAVLFATLGFLCVSGRSVPVSAVEECKEETVMGKITPGRNFAKVMRVASAGEAGVLGRIVAE